MTPKDVAKNATTQAERAVEVSGDTIEAFYPELHTGRVEGAFSNTSGWLLIPDVLTSPHVVVDLYDWPDESGLIQTYGVDLSFLLKLRDRGHVTIAANLLPQDYRRASWLYGLLAESTTLFRSVRTPLFFKQRLPDLEARQSDLERYLSGLFARRSNRTISRLRKLASATNPLKDRSDLARVLALWATRLRAVDTEAGETVIASLKKSPATAIVPLRQQQLYAVSPNSAGLGSQMRIRHERLRAYFPDTPSTTLASYAREGLSRIEAVNAFITRRLLKASPTDITGNQYWDSLREYDRDAILDRLENRQSRIDAQMVEQTLRLEMLKSDPSTWSEREVKHRAERLAAHGERFETCLKYGVMLPAGWFLHRTFEHAPFHLQVLLLLLSDGIVGEMLQGGPLARLCEAAAPKIQLAHFVRRYGE